MKVKADTLLIIGAIAGGVYLIYKVLKTGSELTDKASSAIADIWLKLFPMDAAVQIAGNAKFPGNILVPLSKLPIRQDASHNVYVKYAGYTWQLAPQVNGNYPATRVT